MYDVIIIGAGAAGLMAAGTAARSGKKVLVIEKMEKAARKVRITGKGRCNLTNTRAREEFLSKVRANAGFFARSFDGFDNQDTIDFFRAQEVKLTIERGGRVFPESGKAWDIADALVDYARDSGAEIQFHTTVTAIRTLGNRVCGVKIETKRGFERNLDARNVIVCTGGVSYPATGSTGDGYRFAHELGHEIEAVRPSLVPLASKSTIARSLSGVALKNVGVRLLADGEVIGEEFGEMSFTDRGVEGAVILRLSRRAVDAIIDGHKVEILLDLKSALTEDVLAARLDRELAAFEEEKASTGMEATVSDLLRKLMPKPMISPFAKEAELDIKAKATTVGAQEKIRIIRTLKNLRVEITDYRSFEEAVVTAGGVSVDAIDPDTLQSKLVKGLYFAGEVLDIDADTGGYNLQVAFSTGYLAGQLKG